MPISIVEIFINTLVNGYPYGITYQYTCDAVPVEEDMTHTVLSANSGGVSVWRRSGLDDVSRAHRTVDTGLNPPRAGSRTAGRRWR